MNRYLAKLVFNINIERGENKSQFDEQTWVVTAESSEEAFIKAQEKGKAEEVSWVNKNNKHIAWEFVGVSGLYLFQEDGEKPLYAATYENQDADSFAQSVRNKSMIIQPFFLTLAS